MSWWKKLFRGPGETQKKQAQQSMQQQKTVQQRSPVSKANVPLPASQQQQSRSCYQPVPEEARTDLRVNDFDLEIADTFDIAGRGTVVTGVIKTGMCRVGQDIFLLDREGKSRPAKIKSIEMFRRVLQEAKAGQNVGLGLPDIPKREIQPGMRLVSVNLPLVPGTVHRADTDAFPTPVSEMGETQARQPATQAGDDYATRCVVESYKEQDESRSWDSDRWDGKNSRIDWLRLSRLVA